MGLRRSNVYTFLCNTTKSKFAVISASSQSIRRIFTKSLTLETVDSRKKLVHSDGNCYNPRFLDVNWHRLLVIGCAPDTMIMIATECLADRRKKMQKQAAVNFGDGRFQPVAEKCAGCGRVVEHEGVEYCKSYLYPEVKWKHGLCNFATHAKPEIKVVTTRINPLKAAKRASKRK